MYQRDGSSDIESHRPLPPHCIVYAYCLMPNHVHLLLQEKEESLASVMKSLGVAYAWHYHKKTDRKTNRYRLLHYHQKLVCIKRVPLIHDLYPILFNMYPTSLTNVINIMARIHIYW